MKLANKSQTVGNVTRYEVDYSQWLDEGRTLKSTGFSATLVNDAAGNLPPTDVTVDQVSVTATHLYFFVHGGSGNETFTVQVQVTDTLNEIVIDTVDFTCRAP